MRQVWPDEGANDPEVQSIKGQGCKSGRWAVKAVVLTPGDLGSVPEAD
jgi:hypothetical protein